MKVKDKNRKVKK